MSQTRNKEHICLLPHIKFFHISSIDSNEDMKSASRWVGGRQKGVFLLVELGQYKFKGFAACWAGGGGFSKAFASAAPAQCLKIRFSRFV